ncbi:hypothetical protein [Azohydromonas aeria]|uniref:hypothetical protein n=1 Tax=Azohydromonas aeria TaxID=2590212 RepID=UPI0012FADE1B|nr:hypothetical protein [Azohydromonas aeria]
MTTPIQDMENRVAAYEDAFEELWQQTCLGRFSVAEVKDRLQRLRERFDAQGLARPMELPGSQMPG